jgi:hypothetical protein
VPTSIRDEHLAPLAHVAADMHENWMVSVAAVCRARTDILCAEPMFRAACEHEVVGDRPGAGAVGAAGGLAVVACARSGRRGWALACVWPRLGVAWSGRVGSWLRVMAGWRCPRRAAGRVDCLACPVPRWWRLRAGW